MDYEMRLQSSESQFQNLFEVGDIELWVEH